MDEPASTALFTDLYEFTMAASYLEHGKTGPATFDLVCRELPPGRGYLVVGGVDEALARLERFTFDDAAIEALAEQDLPEHLLDELRGRCLADEVTVRGVPEGRVVFPHEPVLEVTGPLPWAQLAETVLLNSVHTGTLLTTKAARCVHAARAHGDREPVLVDFGARRAHGATAARAAARAAYVAGFAGTSLVEAAREEAIPAFGTMAHSFVQAFEDEREALEAFAESYPDGTTLLVDTYDTPQGVERAARVADELEAAGGSLGGIRIDSGDLAALAEDARERLDAAGHEGVDVFVSGGLDEHRIAELLDAGAPVAGAGVGTQMVTGGDAPSLDLAYKLVEYEGAPVTKLSPGKQVLPARKEVARTTEADGTLGGDAIGRAGEELPGESLLGPLSAPEDRAAAVRAARERFQRAHERLPSDLARLEALGSYPVERTTAIEEAARAARRRARGAPSGA